MGWANWSGGDLSHVLTLKQLGIFFLLHFIDLCVCIRYRLKQLGDF